MKTKHLALFGAFVFLEGILAIVFLHLMRLDAGRGNLLNYQILRPVLEILVALFLFGLGFFLVRLLHCIQAKGIPFFQNNHNPDFFT